MNIRLIEGRCFGPDDRKGTRKVAIVDREFVEKSFGRGVSAVGKHFTYGGRPTKPEDWTEIIGVVEHIQNYGLGQPTREQSYVPYAQNMPFSVSFVVRTEQDPSQLARTIRQALRDVAPDLPVFGVRTMDDYFAQSIGPQRLTVQLLGSFAALALVLACLGLYGVLTYTVGQRTREIGVRMALGAQRGEVISLILKYGAKLAGIGLGLGLVIALSLARLLKTVLYEVSPFDPMSFSLVATVLALVGVGACLIPARRATKIDPMEALRTE